MGQMKEIKKKDEFWNSLQVKAENSRGILVILGDMNGRVGNRSDGIDRFQGVYGRLHMPFLHFDQV